MSPVYTVITFAPVQGFIQKSRKLRDLYGGSFILSYLAKAICEAAKNKGSEVISPALINLTQGTPNQIVIGGNKAFPKEEAETAFNGAWKAVTGTCRKHIEKELPDYEYKWLRCWDAWTNYAWEFFHVAGEDGDSITDVRQKLNQIKYQRAWTGVNWIGESSTLSGADGVAWYGMPSTHPKKASQGEIDDKVRDFYRNLSRKLSNSIIDENEQLSIPELIKRLITTEKVARKINLGKDEVPFIEDLKSFKDVNRKKENLEEKRWTGWFQGDGDKIGDYLQSLVDSGQPEDKSLHNFSQAMMDWGEYLKFFLPDSASKSDDATTYVVPTKVSKEVREKYVQRLNQKIFHKEGRIIYAGGDDFVGVLYRNNPEPELTALECLQWFYKFPKIWRRHQQKITVSIGFVWAAPGVPQRDVLQHCQEAEKSAKSNGRNRLAIRILYNSGNHIEWVCPWWWLERLFTSYRDKEGKKNWTHFYNDVAVLESRHAFEENSEIALALFEIYFGEENCKFLKNSDFRWNYPKEWKASKANYKKNNYEKIKAKRRCKQAGILGESESYKQNGCLRKEAIDEAIDDWVINLAKVGFHLHSN